MNLLIKSPRLFINYFLFLGFIPFFISSNSQASAWLTKLGETETHSTLYKVSYEKFFDKSGNLSNQPAFNKLEFKPYIEHGIKDSLSIGLSPSFQHVSSVNNSGFKDSNSALVYTEIFAKLQLYQGDYDVLSFQQLVELPGIYNEQTTPIFGKKEVFISEKIMYGSSYNINDFKIFINSETGIKAKLNELTGNESGLTLEMDFTLGFVDDEYELYIQPSYKKALSTLRNRLNVLDRYGYDVLTLDISLKKSFSNYDIRVGATQDIAGKNTGLGQGVFISLIKKF